eukprot:1915891-Rhodomonas_salina.1
MSTAVCMPFMPPGETTTRRLGAETKRVVLQVLRQLQAVSIDADEEVLPLGAVLSQLPVDLPMGKLLVLATLFNLEDELMTIAAVSCAHARTRGP